MGKTLLQLLEAWPTPDKLNPNTQKAGMLKPDPANRFTNDTKEALDFVKEMPKYNGNKNIRRELSGLKNFRRIKLKNILHERILYTLKFEE
jgi:hypothetical protein